jgi:hypothetical protein
MVVLHGAVTGAVVQTTDLRRVVFTTSADEIVTIYLDTELVRQLPLDSSKSRCTVLRSYQESGVVVGKGAKRWVFQDLVDESF